MSANPSEPPISKPESLPHAWYLTPRFRIVSLLTIGVFIAVQGIVSLFFRFNDIGGHIEQGKMLLRDGPLAPTWCWYPFGRMVFNAILSLFGPIGGKLVCFSLSIAAAVTTFRIWHKMAQSRMPGSLELSIAAAVFSFLAAFTVVQRDLDECGLQLLLLFFLTAAVAALTEGRKMACGLWTAAAITFKTTPLLFVPFLCWKREWKAAGWAMAFTAILNLLPTVMFSWNETIVYHQRWWDSAVKSATIRDPSANFLEPPRHLNQSLALALARLVQTYPAGHSLYIEHLGFVQFLDLDVDSARRVVKGTILALLAALAWMTRRPAGTEGARHLPSEWGAVIVLATLLSPFCWKQHLVVCLPALFLIGREQLATSHQIRWRTWAIGAFAAIVSLSARGILGEQLADLVLSYKSFTIAGLIALVLLMTRPPNVNSTSATKAESP